MSQAIRTKNYTSSIGSGALYILATIPLFMLVAFLTGGEKALVAIAMVMPVFIVALGRWNPGLVISRTQRDILTGLPLRNGLIDWLDSARTGAQQPGEQLAVIVVSVDELEEIEERHGADMRDAVLAQATKRLQSFTRHDDIIVRLGEDGFGIGLRNVRAPATENLLELSRRLQTSFDEPFSDGPMRSYCTITLGIASESQVKKLTGANLLESAQRANDLAGMVGGGAIRVFSEGLASSRDHERDTAQELCNALEAGDILAWFQPQICLNTGGISGCEALARWDHSERGMVSPASFLPDIEIAGLSQRLAEIMLKNSLTALNAWDAAGFDVPSVSVNFSGDDLRNPRLAEFIRWELDRHSLAPERLVIEVLENVVAESSEDVIARTLTELSNVGCGIDLDDFGTGSTSIMNIQRFNVTRIKIDRCLITHVDREEKQRKMVAALLAMSEKLGIDALAEGVETQAEVETLRNLGCSSLQGYVAARPMPLGDTLQWFEERLPLQKTETSRAI